MEATTTNRAVLVNFHSVPASSDWQRRTTQWLAEVIRQKAPYLVVQADPASGVIDIANMVDWVP
jgi:hypothetical protein